MALLPDVYFPSKCKKTCLSNSSVWQTTLKKPYALLTSHHIIICTLQIHTSRLTA